MNQKLYTAIFLILLSTFISACDRRSTPNPNPNPTPTTTNPQAS